MARLVPQAEKQEETVEGSTVMAVDTSEVIIMTDLETLGRTAVQFSQGVVGSTASGDVLPDAPPTQYVAVCTAVMHDPELYYFVEPNGSWTSELRDSLDLARDDRDAHDDGKAYVCMQVGTHLIGPYTTSGG